MRSALFVIETVKIAEYGMLNAYPHIHASQAAPG